MELDRCLKRECENYKMPQLAEEFEYYVRLYQIYFAWQRDNRNGDFYELCKKEGPAFERIPVIYYKG